MMVRRAALLVVVAAGVPMALVAAACSNDSGSSSQFTGSHPNPPPPEDAGPRVDSNPPPPPPYPFDAAPPPTDATPDVPADAPPPRPLLCPSAPCGPGQQCCAVGDDAGVLELSCMAQCPDAGAAVTCDGRDQCQSQGKLYCCALVTLGAGTPPRCPYTSAWSACMNSCQTTFAQACPANTSDKPCHAASDCAGDPWGETNCCVFGDGGMLTFCVADNLKSYAKQCL